MKIKVWDPLVRIFHWGLALAVLGSFLTSERDRFVPVHVALGLAILAMLVVRVAWGFLGPRPARFASFVRGPRQVLEYAREMLRGRPPRHLSHNPLGGAMVVTILAVLAGLVVTGGVVYAGPEFAGPLTGLVGKRAARGVKEVHEALSNGLLTLIGVHVAGVLASSLLERQNLVAGMITGRKQLDGAPPAPERDSGPGARFASIFSALALGAAAVVAVATLLGFPHRADAAPSVAAGLLEDYRDAARAQRSAFKAFSAEEGRKLYATEHVQDGAPVSCASCHTDDPRKTGRTPAGKIVEPLAPSANRVRLTDRADVEKWFKRNCKQVLGRECTAEEKGNFVTYLLAQ